MGINSPDLSVELGGGVCLTNPVMTASGTFGYGEEFSQYVNLDRLGAVVVKGISLKPRIGNPPPRICETASGMLNAIGLENVGVEKFLSQKMQYLTKTKTKIIVNILGDTVEDYVELSGILNQVEGISAIEVNISCPNVKKGGVAFGTDPKMVEAVTRAVRVVCNKHLLIIKLSPNVTDITQTAQAAEAGGADCVSLINTLLGMAIDVKKRKPVLANIVGGLSGPAIKPIALRMVWQVAQKIKIPIIGIGGITCTEDALEFLLAGATAIQVGTGNFINPRATEDIVEGLEKYLESNQIESVRSLIGQLDIG